MELASTAVLIEGTKFVYRLEEGDRWAATSDGNIVVAKSDGAVLILAPPEYAPRRLAFMATSVDRDLLVELPGEAL